MENLPAYTDREAEEIRRQLQAVTINGTPVFNNVTLESGVHHIIECGNAVSVATVVLRRKREEK